MSEATNIKVLLNLMEKKKLLCPFSRYELFINNKIKRVGPHCNKMMDPTTKQILLKVQFLYVSAYPLY